MSSDAGWLTVDTVRGPARAQVHPSANGARGTLILGHGAGGGTGAKDLQSMLAATEQGWTVVLVEQPWRVAGRRVATPPRTLDAAWRDIVPALLTDGGPLPVGATASRLVVGGRSAGARVACRTSPGDPAAGLPAADGVLCLAFPLHPPGRPEKSRAAELTTPLGHGIPTLVVQGDADPFGSPTQVSAAAAADSAHGPLEVVAVPGSHSPSPDQERVTHSVLDWLNRLG